MKSHLGVVARVMGSLVVLGMLAAPVRGQELTGVSSYAFLTGDDGWTTGGAAPAFPAPAFGVEFNQLTIGLSEFLNFGFWQSPAGAIPGAEGTSLYALRALLDSQISPCNAPTVRVRALAQNFAQSSVLTINSTGDCSAVPGVMPALFTSFFQPQGNAAGTDFIVAVDLLFFDPFDGPAGEIVIDHIDIYRIPVADLGAPTSLHTYTFEGDEEGWTSGAAPSFFDPPVFSYTGSALSIMSTDNISTFGFWNNQTGNFDIEADKLYRARYTYTSSSNTPLASQSAAFRTRLYSSDNQQIQTTDHQLPNLGAGTFTAWFLPPASLVGTAQDGLGAAFDLTNFNPLAPTEVTVVVDEVALDFFDFPSGFKALPFVPTEDTTLPEGEYDFSEIIIPPGVEVTVEGDVKIDVHGDVDVEGMIVGDCVRIEINAGGNVSITGTVANTCSTTPTLGVDLIIQGNGGDLFLGTPDDPAEILSDGDVHISNDPTVADWQFLVPAGGESLVPLPPVAAATSSVLYDAATTTFTTEVQFQGFGADPDGGPVTFAWDFGDGGTSTEQNPLHTFSSPGKRIVTLTVTDNENATAQATLTIVLSDDGDNIPTDPGVQLDPYFIVLEQGEEGLFTAEVFDPDGQELTYNLTLGDLTVSNDEITTHVYVLPGRYELALSVTDTSGTVSTATASVYVHATLPAPPARSGPAPDEPQIIFNVSTDPVKAVGPNAPIIGRRAIPPPHPKAPIGQAGKNMFLQGSGNAIVPAGSLIKAGDGGDGQNRMGQYVTAGNGRKGGSARILVNGNLTIGGGTTIAAGNGGNGGTATATAPINSSGSARGGDGGNAGDYVWIQASKTLTFGPGVVTIDAGSGGNGGTAICNGNSGIVKCNRGDNGGKTWARGGNGGHASKTVIVKGQPIGLFWIDLAGGNGGLGADGTANSGDGGTASLCNPSAFGGHGGSAISYGGTGGNGRLTGAFAAIGFILPASFTGGDGGNGDSDGGIGGDAEAESDCALARAIGGRGGSATASGGKGGRGYNNDGDGGNGDAESGPGGNATATGKQCGDDGSDASATGGDGGSSTANRGLKGGSNGADGTASAFSSNGGNADATGGDGKDKEDAPGGKGGAATSEGGKGGSAFATKGDSVAGNGGNGTSTGGKGGNSVSSPPDPCEDKTGLLGGPGGAATARGGQGGPAGGFQANDFDGFGGDGTATGGAGGNGLAIGGDCDTCGNKGGDASATGGPGGNSNALKGKKGGSTGSDGSADSTGGAGGSASASAGKGGDCTDGSLGGPGGAATTTGGKGGNAAGDDTNTAGTGGSADALGGAGGDSTNPPPDPCESQTAEGGPAGKGTATGGNGGVATGSASSKTDGSGGNALGLGGKGGLADSNGGDCPGCGAKGGSADSTAGPGGEADATKGKKGGAQGGAVDGMAQATGGTGGEALGKGGKGGDCDVCPGGKGGDGGDVVGKSGDGGNATSDDTPTGGNSGDVTITGGNGGIGASCCPKPPLPGGDGGAGGGATATVGTPGTPGGTDGTPTIKAGDGGDGGDGEGPGAGGAAGVGVNVPSGSPGNPGLPCPRTVITPGHSTVPPAPVPNTPYTFSGAGSDGNTYTPIGCTFVAPPGTNQPSYLHDLDNGLLIFQPGNENPNTVPAAVVYDVSGLDVMTIGLEFDVNTSNVEGFPGNCIQIVGFVNDNPVNQGFNLPTTGHSITVILPPPPVAGTSYNKIQINCFTIPTSYSSTTGVRIIDP